MHKVLVNRLGGLSLPRKSVVRLTDRPEMTLDVYHGRKTTIQQQQQLPYQEHCLPYLYFQIFDDAYKSPLSCIIVDDIERLLGM